MKALKEKRIGLRSLWRRGLVILSLFALVFASCGSNETDTAGGKVPLEIKVTKNPSAPSYEGKQVDLTGIEVQARYSDDPNKWVVVSLPALSNFGVLPKYTQRGQEDYLLYVLADGTPIFTSFKVANKNLNRSNTQTAVPGNTANNSQSPDQWADGLALYIPDPKNGYKKEYRVDDFPDFTGIKLQGYYSDNTIQDIPINLDMRWEIQPDYSKNPASGPGSLVIAIGGNTQESGYDSLWFSNAISGYAPPRDQNGAAVRIPLDLVHHVTKVELSKAPEMGGYPGIFYWQNDSNTSWLSANGEDGYVKDAEITVTYSNNTTRTMNMKEAVRQNTVYYNYNPTPDERPLTVQGITESARVDKVKTFWPYHKAPKIYFYYRGYRVPYDVYIYTKFQGFTATPKVGDVIDVDMRHRDNDNAGQRSASWFASQIDVVATFVAYSDSSKTKPLTLGYQAIRPWNAYTAPDDFEGVTGSSYDAAARALAAQGKPFRDLTTATKVPAETKPGSFADWTKTYASGVSTSNQNTPITGGSTPAATYDGGPNVYTMNFGDPDYTWNAAKKIWELGTHAWGECSVTTNEGRTRNLSIYYTPGIGPGPATSATTYEPWEAPGPAVKTQRVQVKWTNIPTAP